MAETENIPPPPTPRCHAGKNLFFWFFLGIALLTGLGYMAVLHFPRPGILVPMEQKSSRIDTLNQRLDILEKRIEERASTEPQTTGKASPLDEEIKKLKVQIENKDAKNFQTAQGFVAAAFSFLDLREAAKTGRSFSPQLAALRASAGGDAKISELAAKLEPFAAGTTPTLAQLREDLKAEEKAAPLPVSESDSASIETRIKSVLQPLISVRPLHDTRFSALEKALEFGDAGAALEAAKALPEEARINIGVWQTKLEARIALDTILQELTAHFTSPSLERGAP